MNIKKLALGGCLAVSHLCTAQPSAEPRTPWTHRDDAAVHGVMLLAEYEDATKFVLASPTHTAAPGFYRVGVTVRNTSRDRRIKATVTIFVRAGGDLVGRKFNKPVELDPGESKEIWGGPAEYGVIVNTWVSGARFF